jgi:ABC-type uncharacterized transport system ATPase subunit
MLQAARNAAYFESDEEMMSILSNTNLTNNQKNSKLIEVYKRRSNDSNKRLEDFEATIKSGGRRRKTRRRKSHRRKTYRR